MLGLDRLEDTPLVELPFKHLVVRDFIDPAALAAAQAAYPDVPGPGSHPPSSLKIEGAFRQLMNALEGDGFRGAVERKFGIDLGGRPTMYTVRGFCRARDGQIHTDSKTKLVTVLLYMNDASWSSEGGRLRLLRSGANLEDYFDEIEPAGGTLLVFQRADNSWHGHHSYEGPRRAVQMNWVTDAGVVAKEQGRHGLSTGIKKLFGFGRAS
ncbi:MAG: 2OG-Fe(II) oxygenase [Rhodobacteraceae bacterium]|nr:2OG-Fe(II) oxygenase [Paracoccaceae bacterium]